MSLHTPKQRSTGLQRPSFGNTATASSPSLRSVSTATDVNRKASLRALTGAGSTTPGSAKMASELEVGDLVNVPGDMYGTVKFVGTVRGKAGQFVGVELDKQFAARGKNNGDVEGVNYFETSVPGAGIFLPIHRAEKKSSPTRSVDSYPTTPQTPSYSTYNGSVRTKDTRTPPTPALPNKFSQSVGPGARPTNARPTSPMFKAKRPSLPRPESPFRKQPNLAPTPGARNLSQSVRGGRPPLGTTPSKQSLKASTSSRPAPGATPRPYSRTGSRLGNRGDEDPVSNAPNLNGRTASNFSQPLRSPSRLGSAGGQDAEVQRLKAQLSERDRRLEEQAAHLAEMESSVKELSALIPTDGLTPGGRATEDDDKNAQQLRQALREKNEKISMLTAEFDAHRADFRSTLDSLEMASTETERVYEEQKRDLLAQLAELQELNQNREDFEGVANQLKQLEELVAELEEGLEESRRGEAEARGEVEFLRGEVERGRSELKREREKAAASLKHASGGSGSSKDLEERDDEIKGLKAIIHNLSDGKATPNGTSSATADPEEVTRLQSALDESRLEKEELEREVEQLRRDAAAGSNTTKTNGHVHTRNASELTEKALPSRPRGDTVKATFAERSRAAALQEENEEHDGDAAREQHGGEVAGSELDGIFCELCKSNSHDTLDCTSLNTSSAQKDGHHGEEDDNQDADAMVRPLAFGKENEHDPKSPPAEANGKEEEKWCALCEKDGHLAFDCPEEQY